MEILLCRTGKAGENTGFPLWINNLQFSATKTLQTEVKVSHSNVTDPFEEGKYFIYCLTGTGNLEQVEDPFVAMNKLFSSEGWKYIAEYQADGHGSSSFAYKKAYGLCNIFVTIDSSCDDEEEGHIPSKFWVEIYCRSNQ